MHKLNELKFDEFAFSDELVNWIEVSHIFDIMNISMNLFTDEMTLNYSQTDSNNETGFAERDETLAQAEIATLGAIFCFILIGNAVVLLCLAIRRVKMSRMYYFLLHLCISDLITGFFNVLPQMAWDITHRFQGGDFLCRSVKYLQILGPYLSSYILVMTAVDRYQAICFPLKIYSSKFGRLNAMISFAWLISLLCCVPQLFIFSYQELHWINGVYDCWGTFAQPWGEKAYVTWYAISVFFIPLIIIAFTYIGICRALWINLRLQKTSNRKKIITDCPPDTTTEKSHSVVVLVGRSYRFHGKGNVEVSVSIPEEMEKVKPSTAINPRTHSVHRLSRAKVKTIKLTVVVITFYIICSSPFICVQLWACWSPDAQYSSLWTGPAITILMLLASLNSCVNPWIYLTFNKNLLQGLIQWSCHHGNKDVVCRIPKANTGNTASRSSHLAVTRCSSSTVTTKCGSRAISPACEEKNDGFFELESEHKSEHCVNKIDEKNPE